MAENSEDFNIDVRMERNYNLHQWREDYKEGQFEMVTEKDYIEFRKASVTHQQLLQIEANRKCPPHPPSDLRWEEFPWLSQAEFQEALECGKEREHLKAENDRKGRLLANKLEKLRLQPAIDGRVPNQLEIQLNVVMVGKTGSGKSATANTILGDKEGFKEGMGLEAVTGEIAIKDSNWNGINVQVIDTPGLFDASISMEEGLNAIARMVVESPDGVHAFIFVVNANNRFTEGELKTLRELKSEFGKEFVKHSMLVFSFGNKIIEDRSSLKTICEALKSKGAGSKTFIESFGNRIIAVDNKSDILAVQQRNRKSLISMALNVSQNCQRAYRKMFFETAQEKKNERKLSKLGEVVFSLIRKKIREDSSFIKLVDQLEVSEEFIREIQEELPLHSPTFTHDEIKECAKNVMVRENVVFEAVYQEVEGYCKSKFRKCVIL